MIFLIERAWCAPLENRVDFGYEVIGYVSDEETAKRVVEEAGFLRGDETWSLKFKKVPTPRMRYKALEEIS